MAHLTTMRLPLRLGRYFAIVAYAILVLGIATVSYREAYNALFWMVPLVILALFSVGLFEFIYKSNKSSLLFIAYIWGWISIGIVLFTLLNISPGVFTFTITLITAASLITIKCWSPSSKRIIVKIIYIWASFSLALILLLAMLAIIETDYNSSSIRSTLPPPNAVRRYIMVIEPIDLDYAEFNIEEQFFVDRSLVGVGKYYEEERNSLDKVTAKSTWKGLFTKEVIIQPEICTLYNCRNIDKSEVELRDLSEGSFLEAMGGNNIRTNTWNGKDSVTWSLNDLSRGVAFTIYPTPYQHLRKISQPFSKAESFGNLFITSFTIVVSVVITSIIKPLIIDVGKNKSKQFIDKLSSKEPTTKARLIVSPTGAEKEIEINKRS